MACRDQVLIEDMGLDDKKVQFIHYSRAFAKHHSMSLTVDSLSYFLLGNDKSGRSLHANGALPTERHWQELERLASYKDNYFFISQMFEEKWRPRPMPALPSDQSSHAFV